MKKILSEIKAQFESVKGQPSLDELIAKDPEMQELCNRIRRGSVSDPTTTEPKNTEQSGVPNDQMIGDEGELND